MFQTRISKHKWGKELDYEVHVHNSNWTREEGRMHCNYQKLLGEGKIQEDQFGFPKPLWDKMCPLPKPALYKYIRQWMELQEQRNLPHISRQGLMLSHMHTYVEMLPYCTRIDDDIKNALNTGEAVKMGRFRDILIQRSHPAWTE